MPALQTWSAGGTAWDPVSVEAAAGSNSIGQLAVPAVNDRLNGGVLACQAPCIGSETLLTVIQHRRAGGGSFRVLREPSVKVSTLESEAYSCTAGPQAQADATIRQGLGGLRENEHKPRQRGLHCKARAGCISSSAGQSYGTQTPTVG